MRKLSILFLMITSLIQADNNKSATINIDLNKPLGAVNKRIFGHNIEAADSYGIFGHKHNHNPGKTGSGLYDPKTKTFDPIVMDLTKQLGATMIRYPGGCLTHNFDWRKTVGPAELRPNYTFGLNEYLQFCQKLGAEPLITVSTYATGPKEAAELVEYLNAPAIEKNPWAMKRKQDGFPEPWGVRWFEIGNESDHGTHHLKPFRKHSPEEYGRFFNECAELMKKVDPSIKLGAHMATGKDAGDPWDCVVLRDVKDTADYIAIHTYFVGIHKRDQKNKGEMLASDVPMRACMASAQQAEERLQSYQKLIKKITKRDIPIAVTEYNAGFVQQEPVPYRFTFGAALFCADYIRHLLNPENNIIMANYWQYHHGYWGTLRKKGKDKNGQMRYYKTPMFYMFQLLTKHFGTRLIKTEVNSPKREFEGYNKAYPCLGEAGKKQILTLNITQAAGTGKGVAWKVSDKAVTIDLKDCDNEQYLTFGNISIKDPGIYRMSFDACFKGSPVKQAVLGLGMTDSHGWEKTFSACAAEGIEHANEWKHFTSYILPLSDCEKMQVLLRIRKNKSEPLNGTIEIKNLTFTKEMANKPYSVVEAMSSLSKDGNTLYVIVFNKDHENDVKTTINCPEGKFEKATYWQISTDKLTNTNLKGDNCKVINDIVLKSIFPNSATIKLPARSMTAIEFKRDI